MLTIFFVVTVTCYNCAVVYVTKFLSAIWHAILDNFRPITIWYATITTAVAGVGIRGICRY